MNGLVTLEQKVLEIIFCGSMYVFSVCSLLLSLTINNDKVPRIIAKLSEIDRLFLTKRDTSRIYKNARLFIEVQITFMTSFLLALLSYGTYVIHGNFSFRNFDYFFYELFPVFLNCTSILHYVNLVLLVKDRYKCLNSALDSPTSLLATNDLKPTENCPFGMKYLNREKGENSISSRRKHFHNLRIIYSKLHDVALLINSTYGMTLLCTTLWVFTGVISGVNYVIKMTPVDNHLYVIVAILWSSFCVAQMIVMAVSCSLAVNECNRSPIIVQKIMLRDDIDREAAKELKKMFSQFKVMKIEFSACGMYRIDLPFLCGIFGATLSYLIIVLQL
jgi:hypothetical protein